MLMPGLVFVASRDWADVPAPAALLSWSGLGAAPEDLNSGLRCSLPGRRAGLRGLCLCPGIFALKTSSLGLSLNLSMYLVPPLSFLISLNFLLLG